MKALSLSRIAGGWLGWAGAALLLALTASVSCRNDDGDSGGEVCLRRFDDQPLNAVRFCASADARGGDRTAVRETSEEDRPDRHIFLQKNDSPSGNEIDATLAESELLPPNASLDAVSSGEFVLGPWEIAFSVQRDDSPAPPTAPSGRRHVPATLYKATGVFDPERSQDTLFRDARTLGLAETPVSDDLTGVDLRQATGGDRLYFSIRGGADIWIQEEGHEPRIWMNASRLGLGDRDDIDALAIQDADLSGAIDASPDMVLFSVTKGSTGLPESAVRRMRDRGEPIGSAIFVVRAGDEDSNRLFLPPAALGLAPEDELDAIDLIYRGTQERCYGLPPWDFSFCGDGVIDAGEACDPASASEACGDGGWCDLGCVCRGCGNGVWEAEWEACDSSASDSSCPGDTDCSDACRCESPNGSCGDGALDPGEACDPGAAGDLCPEDFRCGSDCSCRPIGSVCGDGVLESPESCERNEHCGGGLLCVDCFCEEPPGVCGDGRLDAGENCESGAAECPIGYSCDARCLCVQNAPSVCGDGALGSEEECDATAPGPVGCSNALTCRDCECRLENSARIAPDGETSMRLAENVPICLPQGAWVKLIGDSACPYTLRYYDAGWGGLGEDGGLLAPNDRDPVDGLHEITFYHDDIPNLTQRVEAVWCDRQSTWELDCPNRTIVYSSQGIIESGESICPNADHPLALEGPTGLGWQLGSAPSDFYMGEGVLGDLVPGADYPGPRSTAPVPLDNYPPGDDMISMLTSAFDLYAWPVFCPAVSQSFGDPAGDSYAVAGVCDPAIDLIGVEVSYPQPSTLRVCWMAAAPLQRIPDDIVGYSLFLHGPEGIPSTLDPYFDNIEYEIQLRIDGLFPNVTPTADVFDERGGNFLLAGSISPLDIETGPNSVCAEVPMSFFGGMLTVSGLEGSYVSSVAFQFGSVNDCLDVLDGAGFGGDAQLSVLEP